MSAYVVDRSHILFLIFAAESAASNQSAFRWFHAGQWHELKRNDTPRAVAVANMLWAECVKSVSHRYPSDKPDELPGPINENYLVTAKDFEIAPASWVTVSEPQIFKSLHCYEYQSCEHDGWKTSEAHAFCRALESATIRGLAGYEEAEWGPPLVKATKKSARAKAAAIIEDEMLLVPVELN